MDEPLADPALVPTFLLARFARAEVKAALVGEGSDELFAGYPTYVAASLAARYRGLPGGLRAMLARLAPPSELPAAIRLSVTCCVVSSSRQTYPRPLDTRSGWGTSAPGCSSRWWCQMAHWSHLRAGAARGPRRD